MSEPLAVSLITSAAYVVAKEEFMEEFDIVEHEQLEEKLGANFARFINRIESAGTDLFERKVFGRE